MVRHGYALRADLSSLAPVIWGTSYGKERKVITMRMKFIIAIAAVFLTAVTAAYNLSRASGLTDNGCVYAGKQYTIGSVACMGGFNNVCTATGWMPTAVKCN
jgi:hypothetical protein